MNTILVTGAAGFIGSHLCEALVARGDRVTGVDAFVPYYPRIWKQSNLAGLLQKDGFSFHELDIRNDDLQPLVDTADVIVHLAAMPGLRQSWPEFQLYASCNVNGTQRVLEAAKAAGIDHFIHGSTSSVYGRQADGPESLPLQPVSPYGVTKLAAEHLCHAYGINFGLPLTVLRFFSVYGPRQRPDMAYTLLIDALVHEKPFTRFGDGEQTRSNTYVADIVNAVLRTIDHRDNVAGEILNIGGGEVISLNEAIATLEDLLQRKVQITQQPGVPGDQKHTHANIEKAGELLGYQPGTPVRDGLAAQIEWYCDAEVQVGNGS